MRIASLALLCAALAAPSFAGEVPRPAPDFSVMLPGGKPLSLKSLRGKIAVLTLIFTTCPHCQKMTGELSAIQRDYQEKGVQVVQCAYNVEGANDKAISEFASLYHPAFPLGFSDRTSVFALLQLSIMPTKPVYVPHLLIVDRLGAIRGDYPGEGTFMQNAGPNIRAELDKLVAEQPLPKPRTRAGSAAAKKKK